MILRQRFVWPADRLRQRRKAILLEWATIGVLLSIVAVMYAAMGSSQAMKTAWLEDVLSLVPPIAFLVAARVEMMAPTRFYPWGFLRAGSIAYLVASTAIVSVAAFLVWDSATALVAAEHPTIGAIELFGVTLWQGWVMYAALAYSVVLPVILGRMKLVLARELDDKVLYADAEMNRADWLTGLAAIAGITGVGFGLWWADAAAALLIALDVGRDGIVNLGRAVRDLLDRRPARVGDDQPEPLIAAVEALVASKDWVARHVVSLRTEGRALTGTVEVEPRRDGLDPDTVEALSREIAALDWRLYDVEIVPARLDERTVGQRRADRPPRGLLRDP